MKQLTLFEPVRFEPLKSYCALADRFIFPPFSILHADSVEWIKRSKGWISLGIKGELGRPKALGLYISNFKKRERKQDSEALNHGISVFNPVLAELLYRWFCPHGGLILDPFAGGGCTRNCRRLFRV